ncbi:class I SAM-dependent methyltransferase [Thiotrichales bacterium 19S11-10]|nr:class I SAM-dependent methyltransferase [Thiotrichales bacterium 19S11-10]
MKFLSKSNNFSEKETRELFSELRNGINLDLQPIAPRAQVPFVFTKPLRSPIISHNSSDRKSYGGIREEHTQLPFVIEGSKVLDVGAGSGLISEKMRDQYKCEVYALEPCYERSSSYDQCVSRLGGDYVKKLTLQEAIIKNPDMYRHGFDVVTVFKYNVPLKERDDFLKALAQTVKPGGEVYITSVEPERFILTKDHEVVFLIDHLKNYFNDVSFSRRDSEKGRDWLATCKSPKLELTGDTISEDKKALCSSNPELINLNAKCSLENTELKDQLNFQTLP